MGGTDLSVGFYSGQVGLIYVEPSINPHAYDREVFLTLKEFEPYFNRMEMPATFFDPNDRVRDLFELDQIAVAEAERLGRQEGYQVDFMFPTINGRKLGHADPIRVRRGERVLFHILNASARNVHGLALPNHKFHVLALDGNPVPNPKDVPVLWLAPAERVSAIVEMDYPGVWILGSSQEEMRNAGLGVVVEYAGEKSAALWSEPPPFLLDYRIFARPDDKPIEPDETLELTITTRYGSRDGFDEFLLNGQPFAMESMEPLFKLRYGRRYRFNVGNATDDSHPLHLHRHDFEITSFGGASTAGVIKDVVTIGPYRRLSFDFTANAYGLSLFHCHMQQHMDFGFMALFSCT